MAYLTTVRCTISSPLAVEYFFGGAAINGVTGEVWSKPPGRPVVEEALGDLKAFALVTRVTLVRQLCVQVVEHLPK